MSAETASADSPDLEALFDSIVSANLVAERGGSAPAVREAANNGVATPPADVIGRLGKMARTLHDSLCDLGYDKLLASTSGAIPDALDRLSYVAAMTEQAAQRSLNATETAKPIQTKLASDAGALSGRWDKLFANELGVDEFKELAFQTRDFLGAVPVQARLTNDQLTEVMMAQDFQDLTGQVIKKIAEVVQDLESQMLNLLIENVPVQNRAGATALAGPVVSKKPNADVVTSQAQVDELLESLGF